MFLKPDIPHAAEKWLFCWIIASTRKKLIDHQLRYGIKELISTCMQTIILGIALRDCQQD